MIFSNFVNQTPLDFAEHFNYVDMILLLSKFF